MNKPIHIGLLLQGGRGWLGGFEYTKSILTAIGAVPKDLRSAFRVTLISPDRLSDPDYKQIGGFIDDSLYLSEELSSRAFHRRLTRKIGRTLLRQHYSPVDGILQCHQFNFVYPYTPESGKKKNFAHASWIFDFQHKHLPEFFSSDEMIRRDRYFEQLARFSPLIVLSSEDAERDFHRYFPSAAPKSRVFSFRTPQRDWWYFDNPVGIQHEYCLPDRFFLVANQFWKHKNHLLVLQAVKRLVDQGVFPTVVFTGNLSDSRFPEYRDVVLQTIQQLGIHPHIRLLGIVPKNYYMQLLRRCVAVIQPSLFEGWSTIVEDCRSLGKRIILSDLRVHREQNPPGALFFSRTSEEDLALEMGKSWETFSPGPDAFAEDKARQRNIEDVKAQGVRFLEIAKEAIRLA